jgi:hypothetical protein
MTALEQESFDAAQLKRQLDAVTAYRSQANELRKQAAYADAAAKIAYEKYGAMHAAAEARAVARRRAGLIEVTTDY